MHPEITVAWALGIGLAIVAFLLEIGMILRWRRMGGGLSPAFLGIRSNRDARIAILWRLIIFAFFIYVFLDDPSADGWKPLSILFLGLAYVFRNVLLFRSYRFRKEAKDERR